MDTSREWCFFLELYLWNSYMRVARSDPSSKFTSPCDIIYWPVSFSASYHILSINGLCSSEELWQGVNLVEFSVMTALSISNWLEVMISNPFFKNSSSDIEFIFDLPISSLYFFPFAFSFSFFLKALSSYFLSGFEFMNFTKHGVLR